MSNVRSWGNYPRFEQRTINIVDRRLSLPVCGTSVLPFGNGRSYGDSCLNEDGIVLSCRNLDKFIAFDREQGRVTCEAGVLLSDILKLTAGAGWFLPVTPGTQYVTVGGAIANDVHGKNHHVKGTFGRHVRRFELLRSDGTRLSCDREQNPDYFSATLGGLGLTGFVTWAELDLMQIPGDAIDFEVIKFSSLNEFFELSEESDSGYEYTVAWVDCIAKGSRLGRGIFSRGNHASAPVKARRHTLNVPFTPPMSLVNRWTTPTFNLAYYHTHQQHVHRCLHYDRFLYQLDGIKRWNRLYGQKGFLQYQCVVPNDAIDALLKCIASSGSGSMLTVLKKCGDKPSPGVLSFPQPGTSLAVDFPFVERKTLALFEQLDDIVEASGGRIYPAKDAHVGARRFRKFYPGWRQVEDLRDPAFSSSFWRRVTEEDT